MKKLFVLALIIIVVGGLGWLVYSRVQSAKKLAAQPRGRAAMGGGPVPVGVATVAKKQMPIYLTGLGSVEAYYTVTIKTRVDGQLMKVNFSEGQEVKQGQLLMEIDPKPYQAVLDQAKGQLAKDQATLADNRAEYNRYKALYDAGVSSKETLDSQQASFGQLEGTVKADQAAIEAAQVNLDYCRITSPISGRVGLRLVDPGNIVHAADTTGMLLITQMKPIAVVFTLPEDQLPQVIQKVHAERSLPVEAYDRTDTTKLAEGKLLTLDNQIDPTTGTDKLKAVFPNNDESLFPNQFVNIRLILEQKPDAIVVPSVALQHGSVGDFVYVVNPADNTVSVRVVKVDVAEGTQTIIDSGLQAGEQVVTDGQERLTAHSKVSIRAGSGGKGNNGNAAGAAPQSGADANGGGHHHKSDSQQTQGQP